MIGWVIIGRAIGAQVGDRDKCSSPGGPDRVGGLYVVNNVPGLN